MPKTQKSIIVVDDNPVTQTLFKKILENDNYIVTQCFSGEECLTQVNAEKPSAILMDVILPDGDGKELAKTLMKDPNNQDIALIFTTNTVNPEEDKGYETFEIAGDIYRAFAKPTHNQKLLSVIRKEINRKTHGGKLPKKISDKQDQ